MVNRYEMWDKVRFSNNGDRYEMRGSKKDSLKIV